MLIAASRRLVTTLTFALVVAGCDMSLGHLAGRATDEWTHHYPLAAGGEVRVVNTNGRIEVEPGEDGQVEIRAERIARAATDAGARELLPRIAIKEDVTPDRVSIETVRMSGIMIGAAFEVRYHVRAPRNAAIDMTNTNGQIALNGLAGRIAARTTNGGINVAPDLKVDVTDRSRRRFEGRMNGGGTPVELQTTNGGIRLRPRAAAEAEEEVEDSKATVKRLKNRN